VYSEITKCRLSGSTDLIQVLSLGNQMLTGVFPRTPAQQITKGPLDLVWCRESGLLQLKQSYSLSEMYGDNYGYRSGLNASMVRHLTRKINRLERWVSLSETDVVVDIGSNDATSLKAYSGKHRKVGIDPTGLKFKEYYPADVELIPDFFNAAIFKKTFGNRKAKIVTSIAMFYDLESPGDFVQDIVDILDDDGIWHFEQSYLPAMLRTNSYDTICHEHLEFYSLQVIKNLLGRCGLKIIDVETNDINGGSFAVTAAHANAGHRSHDSMINWMLAEELNMGLNTVTPYLEFAARVEKHRESLVALLASLTEAGKKIYGYGASTKGNVLLQYCGIGKDLVKGIAEVNEQKFGCFTPGSNIPIVSEAEAKADNPDYFLVLPWHFRHTILQREQDFVERGGKFIFPLPFIEVTA
jgi:hypothetical protein